MPQNSTVEIFSAYSASRLSPRLFVSSCMIYACVYRHDSHPNYVNHDLLWVYTPWKQGAIKAIQYEHDIMVTVTSEKSWQNFRSPYQKIYVGLGEIWSGVFYLTSCGLCILTHLSILVGQLSNFELEELLILMTNSKTPHGKRGVPADTQTGLDTYVRLKSDFLQV